jgi:hypothetical protein
MRFASFQQGMRAEVTSSRADRPALADPRVRDLDAARREVLAEGTWSESAAELGRPPVDVLPGVGIHGLVGAAVDAAVGLVVAGDVHAADRHAAAGRLLPDRAGGGLAAGALHRARAADVDGFDMGHA